MAILLCALAGSAQTPLDTGYAHLYNLQFDRAHAEFTRWTAEHPDDPLGPAAHVSAYVFQELNRVGVLESAFLKEDRNFLRGADGDPDPVLRAAIQREGGRAEEKAAPLLARDPQHRGALLALTIAFGAWADYANLVERRRTHALSLFKKSNRAAQALLRADPTAYDAWTASGFTEYLVANLPFYVRWFVRFESVEGDKERAVKQLRLAADRGRYLRPFARILLAVVHLREGRKPEALQLLQALRAEFPHNPIFARELARFAASQSE